MKRKNKDFYIPEGFTGWVTIRYDIPGIPPLPEKEGALQLVIPKNGILNTSTAFEDGWSRDRFFRYDSLNKSIEIPRHLSQNNQTLKWIHWYESHIRSHQQLIPGLKNGTDTLFYDGTRIIKKDSLNVQYIEGRKTIETFYISSQPENLQYNPPANPDSGILVPRLKKLLTEKEKK
ncbi:MAG: hypothetical protein K1X92_14740 [Bacteroidia bacterium]|nr:hypothetical protein [Bacteroidia bacterium]